MDATEVQAEQQAVETVTETPAVETPAELSPEDQLAADALEATESATETPDPLTGVKDHLLGEVTALRQVKRALSDTVDTLKQSMEAAKPPEMSPREKFAAEYPDDPEPSKRTT